MSKEGWARAEVGWARADRHATGRHCQLLSQGQAGLNRPPTSAGPPRPEVTEVGWARADQHATGRHCQLLSQGQAGLNRPPTSAGPPGIAERRAAGQGYRFPVGRRLRRGADCIAWRRLGDGRWPAHRHCRRRRAAGVEAGFRWAAACPFAVRTVFALENASAMRAWLALVRSGPPYLRPGLLAGRVGGGRRSGTPGGERGGGRDRPGERGAGRDHRRRRAGGCGPAGGAGEARELSGPLPDRRRDACATRCGRRFAPRACTARCRSAAGRSRDCRTPGTSSTSWSSPRPSASPPRSDAAGGRTASWHRSERPSSSSRVAADEWTAKLQRRRAAAAAAARCRHRLAGLPKAVAGGDRRVDALSARRGRQPGRARHGRRAAGAPAVGRRPALAPLPRDGLERQHPGDRPGPLVRHRRRGSDQPGRTAFAAGQMVPDRPRCVQRHAAVESPHPPLGLARMEADLVQHPARRYPAEHPEAAGRGGRQAST